MRSDPFVEAVDAYIASERLIRAGDRVLAAVSGGPDSLAMLFALADLQPEVGFELRVASLDHGLRGAAGAADVDYVRRQAEKLRLDFSAGQAGPVGPIAAEEGAGGAPVPIARGSVGLSPEDAARRARYAFLERVAREWGPGPAGPPRVATGHTASDQAETVLMRIVEGTGLHGLAGIAPSRDESDWVVIRPLLGVYRGETAAYCARLGLEPREDKTNLDERYRRNLVRRRLLPVLKDYNPRVEEALVRLSTLARIETAGLERETDRLYRELVFESVPEGERPFGGALGSRGAGAGRGLLAVERERFAGLGQGSRLRLIRCMVTALAGEEVLRDLGHEGAAAADEAARTLQVGGSCDLPGGLRLEAGYRHFFLAAAPPGAVAAATGLEPVTLRVPGETEVLGWTYTVEEGAPPGDDVPRGAAGEGPARIGVVGVELPLTVRTRREGDAFRPAGLSGSKKLKDYFISLKVPRADRDTWPLVVDAQGRIVWVTGLRADERFLADKRPGAPEGPVWRICARRKKDHRPAKIEEGF